MNRFTFWIHTFERAVKTAAQFITFYLVGDFTEIVPTDIFATGANLENLAGYGLSGFLLSVLTSIASAPLSPRGTPSLVSRPADSESTRVQPGDVLLDAN